MFQALLRKQLTEIRMMYSRRRGKGDAAPKNSKGMLVLFIAMYVLIAGSIFALASYVGSTLFKDHYEWVYFLIMGVFAFIAGLVGGVLSAAPILFQAKDNEVLLSMPIPPMMLLVTRMLSLYIISMIYESMVLLPSILFYLFFGHVTVTGVIFSILGMFILGILVLVFSCFFGWIVALLTAKLKNKAFLTVAISVIFIGLILYFRFRARDIFVALTSQAEQINGLIHSWRYPLYSIGLGLSGNVLGFLTFTGITLVLFALTCLILSRSFFRLVSPKGETSKAVFSEQQIRTQGQGAALCRKEMKRFTSSPAYMLNCGLGLLFLLAGAVLLLVKMADIRLIVADLSSTNPMLASAFPVFAVFSICLLCSFCDIAAPSISLEAKTLWIYQTLPVDPYRIFWAKLYVHILPTGVLSLLCVVAAVIALQPGFFVGIFMILCVISFVFFSASSMLALDLKRPMLDWTNEVQPIKQSVNILIDMFGTMLLAGALGVLFLLVSMFAGAGVYLLICTLLFVFFTWLLHNWMRKKGRRIFAAL